MSEFNFDDGPHSVLHWYDFACPFSYVAQHRTAILTASGFEVTALPFQAHAGMPAGGLPIGRRPSATGALLEREARAAGLTLRWPNRIPHSRRALAAAEWVRRNQPGAFPELQRRLFHAHFTLGEDIDDQVVIERYAAISGVDVRSLHAALGDGSAAAAVGQAEWVGRQRGVDGTPAWLVDGRLIIGLQPASDFQRLHELTVRIRR